MQPRTWCWSTVLRIGKASLVTDIIELCICLGWVMLSPELLHQPYACREVHTYGMAACAEYWLIVVCKLLAHHLLRLLHLLVCYVFRRQQRLSMVTGSLSHCGWQLLATASATAFLQLL